LSIDPAFKHKARTCDRTGRTSLGFSGKKYFGSISVVADTTYMVIDEVTLDFVSTLTFANIGFRF
jgi:hypothetical protein